MAEKVLLIEGEWDEKTIASMKGELSSLKCDYLLQYKIKNYTQPKYGRMLWVKTLKTKGKLEIVYEHDEGYFTLEDYMTKYGKQLDVTLRTQIIAHIYQAFQSVVQVTSFSSKHIRLFSLHPRNILIKPVSKGKTNMYVFKFTKYLPQIFYENLIYKRNIDQKTYVQTAPDDYYYISPRFLNINPRTEFKGTKGPITGSENVTVEDMFYSLGCLLAYVDKGVDLIKNVGLPKILDLCHNNAVAPIHEDLSNIGTQQFVQMLMCFTTPMKEIFQDCAYVTTLQNYLVTQDIETEDLEFISKLGNGAFATLFKCNYRDENGKQKIVAVKQFDLKQQGIQLGQVYTEYDMMALCNCPNSVKVEGIVKCKKSIDPTRQQYGDFVYILMECCDLGALDSYVEKHWVHGDIPKEFIEHVFIETLNGLWYLHSQRCIVHRDIKPENILLMTNEKNPLYPHVKLSDLGVSKMILSEDEAPKTFAGTKPFMAPEIQNGGLGETYTYKIDLWSLAVTIYQMVTFNLALGMKDHKATMNCCYDVDVLFTDSIWANFKELRNVLEHLFIYDDEERWGWPELFRNEYIQGLLLKRKWRMLKEICPGQRISEQDAKRQLDDENSKRQYAKLYKIAYKK